MRPGVEGRRGNNALLLAQLPQDLETRNLRGSYACLKKRIKCNSGNPRPILLRLNDVIIEKLVLFGKKCRAEKKRPGAQKERQSAKRSTLVMKQPMQIIL